MDLDGALARPALGHAVPPMAGVPGSHGCRRWDPVLVLWV